MSDSDSSAWGLISAPTDLAILREPRAPFGPFLSDGADLFILVGWRAGRPARAGALTIRRLDARERRRVREALGEAAEEVSYRLPRRKRPGRR